MRTLIGKQQANAREYDFLSHCVRCTCRHIYSNHIALFGVRMQSQSRSRMCFFEIFSHCVICIGSQYNLTPFWITIWRHGCFGARRFVAFKQCVWSLLLFGNSTHWKMFTIFFPPSVSLSSCRINQSELCRRRKKKASNFKIQFYQGANLRAHTFMHQLCTSIFESTPTTHTLFFGLN